MLLICDILKIKLQNKCDILKTMETPSLKIKYTSQSINNSLFSIFLPLDVIFLSAFPLMPFNSAT